jgi:hypothetical protein
MQRSRRRGLSGLNGMSCLPRLRSLLRDLRPGLLGRTRSCLAYDRKDRVTSGDPHIKCGLNLAQILIQRT